MDGRLNPQYEQILSTNALRGWADGPRMWSQMVRAESAVARRRRGELEPPEGDAWPEVPDAGDGLPPLGPIKVSELLRYLVRDHGFDADEATLALSVAMLAAGYPPGFDRVAAADAFDLMRDAIARRV